MASSHNQIHSLRFQKIHTGKQSFLQRQIREEKGIRDREEEIEKKRKRIEKGKDKRRDREEKEKRRKDREEKIVSSFILLIAPKIFFSNLYLYEFVQKSINKY